MKNIKWICLVIITLCMGVPLQADTGKWSAPQADILPRVKEKNLVCPDVSGEPEPVAKIVYSGDVPGIEVNGEVLPPMLYQCHNPHISGAADMVLKLQSCGVRIFEFEVFIENIIRPLV